MPLKVGIPRALLYYRYFPFWRSLLEGLGVEVVTSKRTNKLILDQGVKVTVDDICTPLKLYFGHLLDLKGEVDYLFIPRVVSLEKDKRKKKYTCPKFIGLPDVVRGSLEGIPPVLEMVVDLNRQSLYSSVVELGKRLIRNRHSINLAYEVALKAQAEFQSLLLEGKGVEEAIDIIYGGNSREEASREMKYKVAVVGHSYLIYDPYLSLNLLEKLRGFGALAITNSMVPIEVIEREANKYGTFSWSYEKEIIGAASYFLHHREISGVIILVTFGCGPASIANEIIWHEVRGESKVPLIFLVVDEHTGETGITTRLESFMDIIQRRIK